MYQYNYAPQCVAGFFPKKIDNGEVHTSKMCQYSYAPRCGSGFSPKKIDNGASHVTDSPPHATPWHAASSPAMACSWLGDAEHPMFIPMDLSSSHQVPRGPMTRAQARALETEVTYFLSDMTYDPL